MKSEEDITSCPDTVSYSKGEVKIQSWYTASFAEADYLGVGYLSTIVAIIRSKLYARFQLILLLGSAITFLWYGNSTLNRAITNMQSEFKPEKKDYTINYESSDQVEPYEVPYIYMSFSFILENSDK